MNWLRSLIVGFADFQVRLQLRSALLEVASLKDQADASSRQADCRSREHSTELANLRELLRSENAQINTQMRRVMKQNFEITKAFRSKMNRKQRKAKRDPLLQEIARLRGLVEWQEAKLSELRRRLESDE